MKRCRVLLQVHFEITLIKYSKLEGSSCNTGLTESRAVDFNPTNITGSPPTWFVHRTVSSLVKEPEFVGKFYVHEQSAGVRCTPVQLVKQTHDNVISNLQSGKIAYLDLQTFQNDNETIYPSVEEVRRQLDSIQGAEVVASFAISEAWVSNFSKDCLQGICRDDGIEIGVSAYNNFSTFSDTDRFIPVHSERRISRQSTDERPGQS